jgi:hypothetical protein
MATRGETLLLGTRKGLVTLRRGPGGWAPAALAHPGIPIAYACRDPRTGILWAAQDNGHWGQKLHRSRDGGETWELVPSPRYPEGAVMFDRTSDWENPREVPATLRYLWVIQPGHPAQPGRLYLGTEPGGLFQSDDGGDSWSLVEGLWNHPSRPHWFGGGRDYAGIHSIIVDPRDPAHVFVGISCAGVFETRDDGITWEPRSSGMLADFLPDPTAVIGQDPHFVAPCPAAPDVLWTQHHCGIFRTADGGARWEPVSARGNTAHFGFAVAADETDPLTAWVVPATSDEQRMAVDASLCVCRTEDGGRTWTELRAGLPQTNCYDIVFRHGLDISGDRLAFGSTTGNVYLSEDRGETWACLGTHFAPVYSARFA